MRLAVCPVGFGCNSLMCGITLKVLCGEILGRQFFFPGALNLRSCKLHHTALQRLVFHNPLVRTKVQYQFRKTVIFYEIAYYLEKSFQRLMGGISIFIFYFESQGNHVSPKYDNT